MDILEQLGVNLAIALLSKVIKNPKKYASAEAVIQHVRDDATVALAQMNPAAPPPPGYVAAPQA